MHAYSQTKFLEASSMKSHINTLKQKHTQLEISIKSANDNHLDDITINTLKKQKLLLKERISKLEKRT